MEAAARSVGLSASSAYAFRRRAAGAAFALGWDGARLLARETVVDTLTQRVIDGQEERVTKEDGSEIVRFRYDNRLASTMLARLDRYADGLAATDTGRSARLAAQDFDAYLDLVARDAGPARVALFLRASEVDNGGDTPAARAAAPTGPALEPLAALARADRYARAGAGLASEIDTTDLDPDWPARWTAEQSTRAEAAGLVTLGAPASSMSQLPQLYPEGDATFEDPPVWFDEEMDEWRTRFPPPEDALVDERGEHGDETYERSLTAAEGAIVYAGEQRDYDERQALETAERDAWFLVHLMQDREEDEGSEPDGEQDGKGDAPDPFTTPAPAPLATAAASFEPGRDLYLPDAPSPAPSLPPGGGTDAPPLRSCPTSQPPAAAPDHEGASPWIPRL